MVGRGFRGLNRGARVTSDHPQLHPRSNQVVIERKQVQGSICGNRVPDIDPKATVVFLESRRCILQKRTLVYCPTFELGRVWRPQANARKMRPRRFLTDRGVCAE